MHMSPLLLRGFTLSAELAEAEAPGAANCYSSRDWASNGVVQQEIRDWRTHSPGTYIFGFGLFPGSS